VTRNHVLLTAASPVEVGNPQDPWDVPSGKQSQKTSWKDPPFFMGKSTISTGPWLQQLFVSLPEGTSPFITIKSH
jgi:hypothetical protein